MNRLLFQLAYKLKKRLYLRGYQTPLLDKVVFSKVAAKFGGRVRYLLSGGAPLSPETHEFINICVCAPVLQGYGLTEVSRQTDGQTQHRPMPGGLVDTGSSGPCV